MNPSPGIDPAVSPTSGAPTAPHDHSPGLTPGQAPPGLEGLRPLSLAEINARAALVTRTCRKYLVPTGLVRELFSGAERDFGVLEIDGRNSFLYSSTYLDTPDLRTFHDHRQGRRLRYKVRTRTYVNTGTRMFEVKVQGARGITDKVRVEVPADAPSDRLTLRTREFLDRSLAGYRMTAPDTLVPAAVTDYRRSTVASFCGRERVTVDTELEGHRGDWSVRMRPDVVLLEVKTRGGLTRTERRLHELGVREARFSKYAAALSALEPRLRGNPWLRAMGRCLDHPGPRRNPSTETRAQVRAVADAYGGFT
ncbi:polyphosphate polymerase domain-containing protein [Nocardiopsis sp. MG754419]|uniref:polyphosphate polymerase domain-containing protein n=1 Tax=Nocardiopsis sp. MG754419 TaxID=2259865 RepID=UPI001BA61914|nr:polyphosphate polymerase domain-containing protein [Nocardiopsis sp. MG754419]MBR8741101.1 molecular chaperone [Nocardiopsis sp. MG754419]